MHPVALTGLDERQRAEVTRRWQVLRPVVQDGVVRLAESLALQRPPPGVATITRWAGRAALEQILIDLEVPENAP